MYSDSLEMARRDIACCNGFTIRYPTELIQKKVFTDTGLRLNGGIYLDIQKYDGKIQLILHN